MKTRFKRSIIEPKRDENRKWRRSHDEEFHSLYRSPNRVSKSRILRWTGYIGKIEEGRIAFKMNI